MASILVKIGLGASEGPQKGLLEALALACQILDLQPQFCCVLDPRVLARVGPKRTVKWALRK